MPSRFVRAQWNPLSPIAMLVIISVSTAITGFSTIDYIGFPVCAIWLAVSVYDRRTGGRLIRWMYPEHEENS